MTFIPARSHKLLLGGVFLLLAILLGVDVGGDFNSTGLSWHIAIEVCIGILSASAFCWLLYSRDSAIHALTDAKSMLVASESELRQWQAEAQRWKRDSEVFIKGLSRSIDKQFDVWNLSPAEKDVALLLIKGLSLKEIADARHTSEKTIQAQSLAVYSKSAVRGRNELTAFFLEDLLAPLSP